MKKRVLSLFLALALCLTLLPAAALAEEGGTPQPGEGGESRTSEGAQIGEQTYGTLFEAIGAAVNGDTVELLKDVTEGVEFKKDPGTTVTLVMNGHSLSYATGVALLVKSGKLIIRDEASINGPDLSNAEAVRVSGGALEFQSKATINGGLLVTSYYDPGTETTTNGTIDGGLKDGTILITNGAYSVSVQWSEAYENVCELLPEGYAFAKYDENAENKAGEIVNGYVEQLAESVIVVPHTKHTFQDFTSADMGVFCEECGYTCPHSSFVNGVCTVCGYGCPHTDVDEKGVCAVCKFQMPFEVGDSYYATLQAAFDKASNNSAIYLLADIPAEGKLASGTDTNKTVSLWPDGHTLTETASGIIIGSGATLDIEGAGWSEADKSLESSYTFRVQDGGKLDLGGWSNGKDNPYVFQNILVEGGGKLNFGGNNSNKINTLWIGSTAASIQLSGGQYGKIIGTDALGDSSITAKQLLLNGNMFLNENGSPVPYTTEITKDSGLENVTIAYCTHENIGADRTCKGCGTTNIVAVLSNFGPYRTDNSKSEQSDINQAVMYAFNKLNDGSYTLKLYADAAIDDITLVCGTYPRSHTIDLNGHTITGGTLTVSEDVTLTITDSSEGKGGSFTGVTVTGGGSLIVDGATVGTITAAGKTADGKFPSITLKAGSQLNGINLSGSGLRLFHCLGEGCCIIGDISVAATLTTKHFSIGRIPGTITPPADKNVSISYGGSVSENDFPTVTLDDASGVKLEYEWRYQDSDGNYLSYNSPSNAPITAEDQPLDMICAITAQKSGNVQWRAAVTGYTLTVTKATPIVTPPTPKTDLVYTGEPQELVTAGTTTGGTMWYSRNGQAWYNAPVKAWDAGTYTVWYRVDGNANYSSVPAMSLEGTITIAPKGVTNPTIEIASGSTYDGKAQKPTVTVKDTDGTVIPASEYTVTYSNNVNAGENTATVTITNANGGNYIVNGSAKFSIAKADVPATQTGRITIYNDREATYPYDPATLLADVGIGWTTETELNGQSFDGFYSEATILMGHKDGLPALTVEEYQFGSNVKIGQWNLQFISDNYNDFTLTIDVYASNRLLLTGTPTLSKSEITYGDAISKITLSGTLKYGDEDVAGTFAWTDGTFKPNASSYEAEWKFIPDNTIYAEATGTSSITVKKATPTGAPKYTTINTSGKKLSDAALTTEGGTFSVPGTVAWKLPDTTEVTANTEYKWVFTPNDTDNYNPVDGSVTLWQRSSGGSSSGTTTKTETTTNPDGSVTKTETKSDGTVIETTTGKDGSTTKTETKPDGSSTTETKDASGSTGTVSTDKNGSTTAEAKVSDKAVSDAKKSDEAVKIPTEVTPGENSSSAPTVKIDLPKSSGETKIEIPVKDATSGTVAVIVKADGTEEIVKDSVPTKDGIQLTVDGDVTVKIVNNAKDFTDTKGHWAEASIDFVSARGLVSGTGSTTFSPDAPTTRAQLWTILARQANADLTGGASWYEKAQAWAKANGISDGFDPNGIITRAQMVTMLWRAAGSPEVSGANTFTDVPADSYYAKAVAWAVQHGITTGIGNGKFDPNGTCTRAQIATFLHRSYQSK